MKTLGKPILRPIPKPVATSETHPELTFTLSKETLREIREIENNVRRAMQQAHTIWVD